VPSVLHEIRGRGAASRELTDAALERFVGLGIKRRDHPEIVATAWQLADRLGWAKTYDAEYVALAQLLDARLVTLDARLRRSAAKLVNVVAPAEVWGP
jgi:predicted nucleic acid-binding protein